MTRARKFLHAHPLIAMALGYALLVAFAMIVLPDDPDDFIGRATAHYVRSTT